MVDTENKSSLSPVSLVGQTKREGIPFVLEGCEVNKKKKPVLGFPRVLMDGLAREQSVFGRKEKVFPDCQNES